MEPYVSLVCRYKTSRTPYEAAIVVSVPFPSVVNLTVFDADGNARREGQVPWEGPDSIESVRRGATWN